MPPVNPLILLIDGNNLAHFLYTNLAPGQKMTPADGQRLIEQINNYARTYPQDLLIELCLDRSPGAMPPLAANLRIYYAEYPQTGDDLLLGRFWFHLMGEHACLVITNDEAILEEINQGQGASLRVYDFVRRPGLVTPVFRAPNEFPVISRPIAHDPKKEPALSLGASIYFRIAWEEEQPRTHIVPEIPKPKEIPVRRTIQPTPSQPVHAQHEPEKLPGAPIGEPGVQAWEDDGGASDGQTADIAVETAAEEGLYYFITIENWPIDEGARFLLNSFCPKHRDEYHDLFSAFDRATLRPIDLRALAELLLHACGDEPDFTRQGALMARVRLALLRAHGEPLSLEDLAQQTGLKLSGLRGRIKAKAGRWVEIWNSRP
jgi:hypothetical protein